MFQRRFRAAFGREPLPVVSISTENRVDTSPPAPRWGAAERLRRTALFSSQEGGRKEKAARQHSANEQACRAGRAGASYTCCPPAWCRSARGSCFCLAPSFLAFLCRVSASFWMALATLYERHPSWIAWQGGEQYEIARPKLPEPDTV